MLKVLAGLAALTSLSTWVAAQPAVDNYPTKPVTIVIPVGPGTSTDNEGRLYSQALSKEYSRPFVVENKPGGGVAIGAASVARAAPDGYTLLFVSSDFSATAAFHPDLIYDPIKDFSQISLLTKRSYVFVAKKDAPYSSLKEYIGYAKANPDQINFGTTGPGSLQHLIGAQINQAAGTRVTYVHYKSSSQKTIDMLAGRIDVMFSTFATSAGHTKEGKYRLIGVVNRDRVPLYPDWPTVAEQGMPGVEFPGWLGAMAPAKTPAALVAKLHGMLTKMVREPGLLKKFESDAVMVVASTPEQLRQQITTEMRVLREAADRAGIRGEIGG